MRFSGIAYKNICQKQSEGIFDKKKNNVDNSIYPKNRPFWRAGPLRHTCSWWDYLKYLLCFSVYQKFLQIIFYKYFYK